MGRMLRMSRPRVFSPARSECPHGRGQRFYPVHPAHPGHPDSDNFHAPNPQPQAAAGRTPHEQRSLEAAPGTPHVRAGQHRGGILASFRMMNRLIGRPQRLEGGCSTMPGNMPAKWRGRGACGTQNHTLCPSWDA